MSQLLGSTRALNHDGVPDLQRKRSSFHASPKRHERFPFARRFGVSSMDGHTILIPVSFTSTYGEEGGGLVNAIDIRGSRHALAYARLRHEIAGEGTKVVVDCGCA
jgi:hypothetical protein